jgi:hypothetical protein
MSQFPLRHVSIRVPWHDSGWKGKVCDAPQLNGACAKLKGIAAGKKDHQEILVAGRSLDEIPREQWPCCINERATFMAPFEMGQVKTHALAASNPRHYGHFQPTPQRYPAYSAGVVPFFWMMRKNMEAYRDRLELDVELEREPDLDGYETNWVHEIGNQRALLDGFAAHLQPEASLTFFYAKHVPFVEGTARVLVGAGRVAQIASLSEYRVSGAGMKGVLWERPIQHSIRPNGKDGFLMPYADLQRLAKDDPTLDIARYVANAPEEHWDEFSYGSELVTHDGAIGALIAMDAALLRMESDLGIATAGQRRWLHDELVRMWKVRGPFPGLGAVLSAFGLSRGVFVAHALQQHAGENADPWPQVDALFSNTPPPLPKALMRDVRELATTWRGLPEERAKYLRLLSRFELTVEQAKALYEHGSRVKAGWGGSDREIIENPYRIYELSRNYHEGIRLLTLDRGVFPDDAVRLLHPLPEPSRLESGVDWRRVRAFAIAALEDAAAAGHSLLPAAHAVAAIRDRPARPECGVTADTLAAQAPKMAPEVASIADGGDLALQLARYEQIGKLVRNQLKRVDGNRHAIVKDWAAAVRQKLGDPIDAEDERAHQEKATTLKEIAESRLSVLVGPAGAGKTTVLGVLCDQPEISSEAILMLAPTGKARVRMQQLAGGTGVAAFTIAQFLNQHGRYEAATGRYVLSPRPKVGGYATVVVDESSMLTEDMLGALFDALQSVKRFIFVGDPAQLPPIGAGRPFVDIIARLRPDDTESRFPRVSKGYAELTVERRQVGSERPDLRLARWFSANPPSAGEDDIFTAGAEEHANIGFVEWQSSEEFQARLLEVLVRELKLTNVDDAVGFNLAMGSTDGEYQYFNRSRPGEAGAVGKVDAWQILSPLRGMPFGVGDINRLIHERFRKGFLDLASSYPRSIPKPMGSERVVYGDKVINLANHRRDGKRVFPQDNAIGYLANGEIGIAVGQWKSRASPKILKIEFTSQPGFTYDFYGSDFKEEGEAALELAYALTVHKAQGSQFGLVILVLPEGHPILSRELIYTALTRHERRVIVMHQGPRSILKDFASPHRSETARRMTNLLSACKMREVPLAKGSVFLQEGLVHRTSKGVAVRSKSELIIAEALANAGIAFEYEKQLVLGGATRYPDFTIEDEITGRTIFWEHLGMLERSDYRRSWEKKLAWYRANDVLPAEEGGGSGGMLVTTTESSQHGFDVAKVHALINEHLGE